jgi:hypothetical protein
MATRDHITGMTSRRDVLRRAGGATVTIAAAGIPIAPTVTATAAATAAPGDPDATLLALADRFWREHRQYVALKRREERLRDRALRDLGRDAFEDPVQGPKLSAAWTAWNAAFERLKEQAPAIFARPARTPAGVLAKLRIFGVAYGIDDDPEKAAAEGRDVGDIDLYAITEGWLASAVRDLEAIVGSGAGAGA